MFSSWNTRLMLVLRAAFLALLTGCGIVNNTNIPKPTEPGSSAGTVAVAPDGLRLGYVWNAETRNLYPVVGVSGAAHYGGGALASDPTIIAAAGVSATSSAWGVVLHNDGKLEQWTFANSNVTALAQSVAIDSKIVLSPSGNSAALVSASSGTAVVVTGLPAKAQVTLLKLPAGFVDGAVAVSDAGSLLAATAGVGTGVQIGILSDTRAFDPVMTVQAWGGAGFAPGASGNAAVIGDGASGQLMYVSNLNGTVASAVPLASAGLLQKPVAAAVSPDGKWAYAADSAKPQIVRVSIGPSSIPATAIACGCTVKQMVPLTGDGIYSLTKSAQGQPEWLLDARTSQPKAFFVPAMNGSSSKQLAQSAAKAAGGGAQ